MGRPATLPLCREVHSLLLGKGLQPGVRIPRDKWNALLVQGAEASSAYARVLTKTGSDAGLWRIHEGIRLGGRIQAGSIELLPLMQPSAPMQPA